MPPLWPPSQRVCGWWLRESYYTFRGRVQISIELHLQYFKDPNICSSNLSANESHFSNLTPSIIFHILASKNIT
jgi:hypothetical protein